MSIRRLRPERMRRSRRVIGSVILSILIVLSFLSWKRKEIQNFLPDRTHKELHLEQNQKPLPSSPSPTDHVTNGFLERPLLNYDEAVQLNTASCTTKGVNFDAGSVKENENKWRNIPSHQISKWRQDIAAYLQETADLEPSIAKDRRGGRGIVMATGDHDDIIRARTNIRLLRSYNCTLPIEIFHFSDELSDAQKTIILDLEVPDRPDLNETKVTFRVVKGIEKGRGWKAFEIKGPAIQQSSFEDILYLDTDSYLLRNPEYLFDGKHYHETGLLLWPDYTKSHATNPIWRLVGLPCRNEYEGESGQIFISRTRHQDVMWVAEYFAGYHDRFYGFMGGDRDSFRTAALLLGKKWNGPGRMNAVAGVTLKDNPKGGGHTMLQADPEGRWMFVHANLIKHGHFELPLWSKIHRAARDRYEGRSTYGSIEPPNDGLGDGIKLRVDQDPKLVSTMETFEGYDESLIVVEAWDTYEDLKGFEEKWFRFGGEH